MEISLEQQQALATVSLAIANNPKTRKAYLRMVKEVAPNQPIPEIDEPDRVEKEMIAPLRAENLKLTQRLDQMELDGKVGRIWSEVKTKTGISDDDVPKVAKLMEEKLIASPLTAAEFYMQTQRVATPRGQGGPFQLPWRAGLDRFNGLFQNRDTWARNEAFSWLKERDAAQRS